MPRPSKNRQKRTTTSIQRSAKKQAISTHSTSKKLEKNKNRVIVPPKRKALWSNQYGDSSTYKKAAK